MVTTKAQTLSSRSLNNDRPRLTGRHQDIQTVFVQSQDERRIVYQLRYEIYIAEQGKAYPQADHEKKLLFDEADDYIGACLLISVAGTPVATVRTTHLHDPRAY